MRKKVLIIHHTDLDGAAAAAVVALWYKRNEKEDDYTITYRKHSYGWPLEKKDLAGYDQIWAVDISFKEYPWVYECPNLVWVDHHQSSIYDPALSCIPGLRREGVGACELVWELCFPDIECADLIKFLSAWDVWDKKRFDWKFIEKIQYGAKERYKIEPALILEDLVSGEPMGSIIYDLSEAGDIIVGYESRKWRGQCKMYCSSLNLNGLRVVALNTPDFCSKVFEAVWDAAKFDLMMPYLITPDGRVRCSIYTSKPEINCAQIAETFGGGGHPGAAGFQLDMSIFLELFKNSQKIKTV